jgi:hypothetical protein
VLAHFRLPARLFLERGHELRPLGCTSLELREATRLVGDLAASGLLDGVRHLDLGGCALGDADLRALAGWPGLGSLTSLRVTSSHFGRPACRDLARSPHLANLTALVTAWGNAALFEALAEAALPRLRKLEVVDSQVTPALLTRLARSPRAWSLAELNLSFNPVGSAGARSLARAPHLKGLREVGLWRCELGDRGVRLLASSTNLREATYLGLQHNAIGPAGAEVLARWPWGALLRLALADNPLGDASLGALAGSPGLGALACLDLGGTHLTDAGVRALASSGLLARLRYLDLHGNPGITGAGARALAEAPASAGLLELNLGHCALVDEGARALFESPHLAGLGALFLIGNGIGAEMGGRLRAHFGGRVVV